MAKPFKTLRDKMSPESRARSQKLADELRREMWLAELRDSLGISQEELGSLLNKGQAAISRVERRTDMHVSTLREFVTALGGRLEITARFPGGEVRITQFDEEQSGDRLALASV